MAVQHWSSPCVSPDSLAESNCCCYCAYGCGASDAAVASDGPRRTCPRRVPSCPGWTWKTAANVIRERPNQPPQLREASAVALQNVPAPFVEAPPRNWIEDLTKH